MFAATNATINHGLNGQRPYLIDGHGIIAKKHRMERRILFDILAIRAQKVSRNSVPDFSTFRQL
jgi:hypothetical protein